MNQFNQHLRRSIQSNDNQKMRRSFRARMDAAYNDFNWMWDSILKVLAEIKNRELWHQFVLSIRIDLIWNGRVPKLHVFYQLGLFLFSSMSETSALASPTKGSAMGGNVGNHGLCPKRVNGGTSLRSLCGRRQSRTVAIILSPRQPQGLLIYFHSVSFKSCLSTPPNRSSRDARFCSVRV